ncbi:MAG: pilus assembly protein N-terminal domain-containing protein [Gammaproteobacteria bacterium]|nr:pilus assembly protein N-terminal domain-containing protein [Gammaproteobacteria bacterium]MCP5201528.1 pilus assembly protein N-terminal domain-containing protein [Gammaproteobacteria bacterium]
MTFHSGLTGKGARSPWRALAIGLLLALFALPALAVTLKVGEVRILRPGDIDRVAVGNAGIISSSLLKNGQLLVFGEAPGVTTLHIWLKNGQESNLTFTVDSAEYALAANSGVLREKKAAVERMLSGVPGVEATVVGDKIVLSGQYGTEYADVVNNVKSSFPEVLDLTLSGRFAEVQQMLSHVPHLEMRTVGKHIVLTGRIDESYAETISTVQAQYSEVMDLTRKEEVELPDDKLVLMNIKIAEFNKSATDNLGINWTNSFAGPAAMISASEGFGATRAAGNTAAVGTNAPATVSAIDPAVTQPSFGYFGIATEITSRINLAVGSGDALILAEPRLVARSGGEASFLAGGEVPIEIVTPTSASIEFKQFGILLNIKPEVDYDNNIRANVETEISAVDQSVAVGNTPGFLTRRTSADILLASGQTLVMSGLVDRELGRDMTGLKGFADIPVLGALFRSRSFRDSKTDLVIFVTPVVYDADDQANLDAIAREREQTDTFVNTMRKSTFKLVD